MSGGENTMYRFPSARSELSSLRNSRMPVASTDCGCCATAICFHTPQVARSRKIPSETRKSLRKFRHSKQENATATPGKTQMKYRLKKALVPSSARTKPASGMQRNNQPMDSPSSIGGTTFLRGRSPTERSRPRSARATAKRRETTAGRSPGVPRTTAGSRSRRRTCGKTRRSAATRARPEQRLRRIRRSALRKDAAPASSAEVPTARTAPGTSPRSNAW